jgi:anti-sigma factor RsiW
MTRFSCRWTRSRLPLLAGDDLVGPDRRLVERHLTTCPSCRARLRDLSATVGVLRLAGADDPVPPDLAAPLWPGLEREIRESRRPDARRPRVAWPVAAAAAAALLAGAALLAWAMGPSLSRPGSPGSIASRAGARSRSTLESRLLPDPASALTPTPRHATATNTASTRPGRAWTRADEGLARQRVAMDPPPGPGPVAVGTTQ